MVTMSRLGITVTVRYFDAYAHNPALVQLATKEVL